MVLFCPMCHKVLILNKDVNIKFHCSCCSYILPIKEKITNTMMLTQKKSADIFTKDDEDRGSLTQGI